MVPKVSWNTTKWKIKRKSSWILKLFSADVRIEYNEATGDYFIKNLMTNNVPSLIHGNGPSKTLINNFGSYLAGAFKHNECQFCKEQKLEKLQVCQISIYYLQSNISIFTSLLGWTKFAESDDCSNYTKGDAIFRRVFRFNSSIGLSERQIKRIYL